MLVLLPKCAAPTDQKNDIYADDTTVSHARDGDRDRSRQIGDVESVFGSAATGEVTDNHLKGKIDSTSNAQQQSATTHVSAKSQQRLITFASTDPEFDEDSDPDGDLDL